MIEHNTMPETVQQAWDAYQAMGKSKTDYFEFLSDLDKKYKQKGSPTIAENLQLEKLLKVHDEKVSAFNEAMALITEKDDRELLLKKLSADAPHNGMH